jgi:adenylate cyclase
MAKDQLSRKLAVLLHADVVGSTSLVQKNETLAHERIQDTFRRFSKTIVTHNGIAHEIRGDALVAEFTRVSDAVGAAVDFQLGNATHIEELQDEIRPIVRIGIAMGEVIIADNTVTGEGIVLAQRLEQLAGPGSVCIQGAAYETVPKRLPFVFENLGDHSLKGFEEPVSAYAVKHESDTTVVVTKATSLEGPVGDDLSDKPSIAVLPFTNMSGDSEQEYFSDGITEDIISALSRFRELFVIAKNSSFIFKEQNINASEVATKLGVQYVIEGSVRKAANRVRVTAQLVDAATASQIWSDRYDREMEDIFAVQDEVVAAIVSALPNQIRHVELARPQRTKADIRAYDLVLHASAQGLDTWKEAASAIALLEQALEIEPDYALAHCWLSNAYAMEWDFRLIPKPETIVAKIMKHSFRAVELDQTDGYAYMVLSDNCLFIMEDLTQARVYAERAVQLNPNSSPIVAWRGYIHNCDGESKQAMELCARATRLDPLAFGWVKFLHGVVCFDAGQYDRAIDMFLTTNWEEKWGHLAAAYALTGQTDRAREIAKRTRQMWIESSPQDLDERIQELFNTGGLYNHGNLDGSLEKGLRIAGFLR